MTNRSLYPNNVEVQQRDLAYTESSKSEAIRERTIDTLGEGRVSGLVVSQFGAAPSTLQVTPGRAYMPNGELADLPATLTNIQLSDPTDLNYVVVRYTEIEGTAAAHEYDGTTRNTRATAKVDVGVYIQAELDALPTTLDDQTQIARDRVAIIAEVSGPGAGASIPNANISQGPLGSVYYTVTGLEDLPGIEFVSTTTTTTTSTGSLRLVASSRSGDANDRRTFTIEYASPGDSLGTPVAVSGSGEFTATSSTSGETITVFIEEGALRQTTTTATLTFLTVYDTASHQPANTDDHLHRQAQGSHGPSQANPHGQALLDLATTLLRGVPALFQKTGPLNASDVSPADRPAVTTRGDTIGTGVTAVWELHSEFIQPNNTGAALRVYLRSDTAPAHGGAVCITRNARYSNEVGPAWSADDTSAAAQRLVIGGDSFRNTDGLGFRFDFADTTTTTASWTEDAWDRDTLNVQQDFVNLARIRQVRPTLEDASTSGNSIDYQLLATFGTNATGSLTGNEDYIDSCIRLYQRFVNDGGGLYIADGFDLTYNAEWIPNTWQLDTASAATSTPVTRGAAAWRLHVTNINAAGASIVTPSIEVQYEDSGATFADGAWSTLLTVGSAGVVAASASLTTLTGTSATFASFNYTAPRTFSRTVNAASALPFLPGGVSQSIPLIDLNGGGVLGNGETVVYDIGQHLPVGATVTDITMYFTALTAATVDLVTMNTSGAISVIASNVYGGATAAVPLNAIGHVHTASTALMYRVTNSAGADRNALFFLIEGTSTSPLT